MIEDGSFLMPEIVFKMVFKNWTEIFQITGQPTGNRGHENII